MRLIFFFILSIPAFAQITPPSGPFTSSDGMYTATFEFGENTITVVEPNKTSVYTKVGENLYAFTNPTNGREYKLEVEDETTLLAHGSSGKTYFYYTGDLNVAANNEDFEKYQAVAEKYQEKMESDPDNLQLWVMCAAAAMKRGTLNKEGFETYARTIILSLRQLVTNPATCPCDDAIPTTLWNAVR